MSGIDPYKQLMEVTDGQLLDRFLTQDRQEAFQELLKRHGPMVMGVCRRILGNTHDAEDAFQATFIVLLRKAGSMRSWETIAGWLYQVAFRSASKLRSRRVVRHERETLISDETLFDAMNTAQTTLWDEVRPVLDEELNRLSEKYRLPMILCYIEGKSYEETAQSLGVSHAAVKTRLDRARHLLRSRLARRGITLSAVALGSLISENASAAVPTSLMELTFQSASPVAGADFIEMQGSTPRAFELAKDVGQSMLWQKVVTGSLVILLVVVAGVGWMKYSSSILSATAVSRGKPDLIIVDVGWTPANPVAGDEVLFHAEVQNRGTAPTPNRVRLSVTFLIDDRVVSWSSLHMATLPVGSSKALLLQADQGLAISDAQRVWTATPGTHALRACVDDIDRISETDETNNEFKTTLVIPDAKSARSY